jgi:monovalent cation:H+ antiporter-2, CPA2 family
LRTDPLSTLPTSVEEKFLAGQVVLVGYGRVGQRIAKTLSEHNIPFVVVDINRDLIEKLRDANMPAVCGDASNPEVLIQAHIVNASLLIAATSNTFHVKNMIDTARQLNPTIETVIRTHNEEEATLWERENIGKVFLSEQQLADGISEHVLTRMGKHAQRAKDH